MRSIVLVIVLALLITVPTQALPLLTAEEAALPSGMNGVANIENFAMAHPARFGESALMTAAREDLKARLAGMGYTVEVHNYGSGQNILGILPGIARPNDWVVLSAHYDTVAVPLNGLVGATAFGAWDDGSGVAALLEIARVAAARPWNNTLVIAFFDDEEAGLVGSSRFVQAYDGQMRDGSPISLRANVNMDPPGLNWPCVDGTGIGMPVTLFQAAPGGKPGSDMIQALARAAAAAQGVPADRLEFFRGGVTIAFVLSGSSDNAAFGSKGIADMYVGSSAHLIVGGTRLDTTYPLHTPSDTLQAMIAWCGGDVSRLAQAMQVEMRMAYDMLLGIDEHGARFPRP